ncbi:MAG: amidophosphoribosyltransferase [Desulfurivibrionaceae bacterium]|nr:amidophosphoribosyltransferase [Desulfurivibrionaceae bacterium]
MSKNNTICNTGKDRPRDRCGLCGVAGHAEAARLTYFGLYALQHRGQKSAGIAAFGGHRTQRHAAAGLVSEVFSEKQLRSLKGTTAIGHVQDAASRNLALADFQPFTATHRDRTYSVAQNGSFTNLQRLRAALQDKGAIFYSSIDCETIVHLLAHCREHAIENALPSILEAIEGAYSLLLMVNDTLIAIRDPNGFRPLCLGALDNGGYVVASETCALDLIGARFLRDIQPGELLMIDPRGKHSIRLNADRPTRFCIFEQVYFARPDSAVFGANVYQSRKRMGRVLARECRIDADLVMPFPDSGTYAALGYAQETGTAFEMGMIRNHYIGRTFIQPARNDRAFAVRMKLNPVAALLKDKRVVLVDDSAISGATVSSKVRALRHGGAREIHLLVSCPPIRFACHYGIHFPAEAKLLANERSVEQIQEHLGLDTLHFLSLEGLLQAAGGGDDAYCKACMDGEYPLACDPSPQACKTIQTILTNPKEKPCIKR